MGAECEPVQLVRKRGCVLEHATEPFAQVQRLQSVQDDGGSREDPSRAKTLEHTETNRIAGQQLQRAEVLDWLTLKFADWLEVSAEELDSRRPISSYGLDSISAVTLSVQLEEELGVELDTAVLWERPTLESLAEHLADSLNAEGRKLP